MSSAATEQINRDIARWMRSTLAAHPELAMPVERAFLERLQETLAEVADAPHQSLTLCGLQGQCSALAAILGELLEPTQ